MTLDKKHEPPTGLGRFRDGVNWFVYRHDLAWTLTMVVLALLYLLLAIVEEKNYPAVGTPVQVGINGITAVFLLEFGIRFYAAPSRWHYLKYHWIDLLAVIPSARFLRILGLARLTILLRLFRIARLAVIARSLADANRATRQLRWIGERNGLPTLFLVAGGLLWIGSGAVYELEHGVNPQYATYGDAFWWAFSTMATLGAGNGPATVPGRLVAGVLMVVGIACFGLVTATVTTFIMRRTEGTRDYSTSDLMDVMKDLQGRLSRLEEALTSAPNPAAVAPPAGETSGGSSSTPPR